MLKLAAAIMFAAVFVVGAPSAASASGGDSVAGASPVRVQMSAAAAAAQCSTYRVESIANNLPIRVAAQHTAALHTVAQKGYRYNCTGWYVLGDRYTACGVTNANGWLELDFGGAWRYTYMTCLKDV
ncbi:hypothetical protein Ais01nite_63540 [Asanoa ishikariensis]|nr:hypothetical protein Ais01nite_63540 [Asanoa ishikariensis]